MNNFISGNYNIIYKGENVDVNDLSKVDEFLLGDNHGSIIHSEINSLFINTFSNEDDVVMVEAMPSMKKIEKNEALQSVWLKTQSPLFGWDSGTIKDMGFPSEFQESGALAIQTEIRVRNLLDPAFSDNKEGLKKELSKLIIKQMPFLSTLPWGSIQDCIKRTFPGRTQSMKDSLIAAKRISARTFLIAGESHLKENPKYLLGDFPEFLKKRNVVVLFPKQEINTERSRERTDTLLNAMFSSLCS
jgi:hypothetical protein